MNIVAYGSLMSQSSLEATLRRPAPLTKVTIGGWRRTFDAAFPDGFAYLNLRPAPGSQIEAAYFTLEAAELALFAEREEGANLTEVARGYQAFVWPRERCRPLPVLCSYIDICRRGAAELGISLSTGTTWPSAIHDDTAAPLYP
ncbi:MAG TPA: gamma-glutamylcyclotransferase family protein [Trebonia sp.]|nr:gamma-glutamylcyclotransferase family protein [Trebonia sp.]